MTQKVPGKKGNDFLRAIGDLLILVLLMSATGFGGYWFGTQQRMVPVELVAPGTPGAKVAPLTSVRPAIQTVAAKSAEPAAAQEPPTIEAPTKSVSAAPTPKAHGKMKYWIASSGSDSIGYSVTVSVNGAPVDNFFAPGKSIDVTRLVKKGTNDVSFEAKVLEEKYNQHKGDQNYKLTLTLVGAPSIQENYKPDDVLLSYRRTAADTQDFTDNMHFEI